MNPDYHAVMTEGGMVFSGTSPDGKLVEFIELPNSKYFVNNYIYISVDTLQNTKLLLPTVFSLRVVTLFTDMFM